MVNDHGRNENPFCCCSRSQPSQVAQPLRASHASAPSSGQNVTGAPRGAAALDRAHRLPCRREACTGVAGALRRLPTPTDTPGGCWELWWLASRSSGAHSRRAPFAEATGGSLRASDERKLAEGVGFEPTVRFPVRRFSRPLPSTARPSLRGLANYCRTRTSGFQTFGSDRPFGPMDPGAASVKLEFDAGNLCPSSTAATRSRLHHRGSGPVSCPVCSWSMSRGLRAGLRRSLTTWV